MLHTHTTHTHTRTYSVKIFTSKVYPHDDTWHKKQYKENRGNKKLDPVVSSVCAARVFADFVSSVQIFLCIWMRRPVIESIVYSI